MPHQQSLQKVQSLKILAMATASGIAKEIDFKFVKSIAIIDPNTLEYAGFNSKRYGMVCGLICLSRPPSCASGREMVGLLG